MNRGTILVDDLILRATRTLHDESARRWGVDELLSYINNGQRSVAKVMPDAYPVLEYLPLMPGAIQSIPGWKLLGVFRNTNADGSLPGRAIVLVTRETLDRHVPEWTVLPPGSTVECYFYDERDPQRFGVYPASDGTGHVEALYSDVPEDVALGQPIALNDVYAEALFAYVMFSAYQKDSDSTQGQGRAMLYYQLYMNGLGLMRRQTGQQPLAEVAGAEGAQHGVL